MTIDDLSGRVTVTVSGVYQRGEFSLDGSTNIGPKRTFHLACKPPLFVSTYNRWKFKPTIDVEGFIIGNRPSEIQLALLSRTDIATSTAQRKCSHKLEFRYIITCLAYERYLNEMSVAVLPSWVAGYLRWAYASWQNESPIRLLTAMIPGDWQFVPASDRFDSRVFFNKQQVWTGLGINPEWPATYYASVGPLWLTEYLPWAYAEKRVKSPLRHLATLMPGTWFFCPNGNGTGSVRFNTQHVWTGPAADYPPEQITTLNGGYLLRQGPILS